MKNASLLLIAGMAFAANAQTLLDPADYTITAQAIDGQVISAPETLGTYYSDMDATNGYLAFSPSDYLGYEDYDSTAPNSDIDLQTMRFVGGVANAGEILYFNFYDTSLAYTTGFGVTFTQGGNFIYTITINTFPGGVVIPEAGVMEIVADTASGSTGQWFMTDSAPTIGANDPGYGYGSANQPSLSHKFELTGNDVPVPGATALLALGGLTAARRRR